MKIERNKNTNLKVFGDIRNGEVFESTTGNIYIKIDDCSAPFNALNLETGVRNYFVSENEVEVHKAKLVIGEE